MANIVLNSEELKLINYEIKLNSDVLLNMHLPSLDSELNVINKNVQGEELTTILYKIVNEFSEVKTDLTKNITKLNDFLDKQVEEYSQQEKELGVELATVMRRMSGVIDASNGKPKDFVNYYQYNYNNSYGYGTTIASSGCGPTSVAMVLTSLTGEEVTPIETANWSLENGFRVKGNGTSWGYFDAIANEYGLESEGMAVSKENIISNLENNNMIIMSMKPGHFTNSGHFIVLTGITKDGKITVADPNSEERSNTTYDINVFLREGKKQWVFYDE